jgi:hypothetical protein
VEELTVATTADPAIDPLQVSVAAPAPDRNVVVTVRVRNAGRGTTSGVTVALYAGTPGSGTLVDSVDVPGGLAFNESYNAEFAIAGTGGEQPLYAELTTDGENTSSNNDLATKVLGELSTPLMMQVIDSDQFVGALQVDWSAVPDEYVTGFRILRGASAEGPFELVGESSLPTFTDPMVQHWQSYCYAVQAYNANSFSEQSEPRCGELSLDNLYIPVVEKR